MTPPNDLTQTQMHLRRDTQDWFDERSGNSRQSVEAPPEFVADQTVNGNFMDRIRRTKESLDGRALLAAA